MMRTPQDWTDFDADELEYFARHGFTRAHETHANVVRDVPIGGVLSIAPYVTNGTLAYWCAHLRDSDVETIGPYVETPRDAVKQCEVWLEQKQRQADEAT